MYDTIIIGSGPAGITASIYIKRAGFKVLVISKNQSMLNKVEKIENYYGFKNAISGKELIENGIAQAEKIGVKILQREVTNIKYSQDNLYEVITANQPLCEKYLTKTVILATGVNRNTPQIKGIKEFEGKGVSYCAICDARFYKNKDVAVLGSGYYALSEIEELLPIAKSVTMVTNGAEPVQYRKENLSVNEKKIKEIKGSNTVEEIEFKDNSKQKIDGLFVAQGVASSLEFAKKLGAKIENNYILVNEDMETNIPNVYACGDCTGGILQISKAIYEGTKAGLSVINKLRG